ncbi:DEAD-box ATP-dependent RNA helicase 35-like [Prunus yedoensis var. nudiflora]|uniref:DEAD-box ATP-dependent RNA helicase 35-like n=1 Tax=Prunus yedoensis var. nudiflora TaxID=2094558 RepID=A0A314Z1C4_PRUYE|nr:DEAD-box ATP-dependent RNA helicase 35-like [Prunus yedoensis var. nudiflora]
MPTKVLDFAKNALVKPATVNVGRPGAANLGVIQEVEYVKQEAKFVYLFECLQKTASPVIIFCENKADVDDIHKYLLIKGVDAVGIHARMDQNERKRMPFLPSRKRRKMSWLPLVLSQRVWIFWIFNMSSIMTCQHRLKTMST